ncbi:MAG: TrkA family potassium uptake protein [Acidimicrobiales bacterium]
MPTFDRLLDWIRNQNDQPSSAESVFVVGLGRFGSALANRLVELDVEVMAIDMDIELVNEWAGRLTHVRQADGTNHKTLKQLGAADFDVAVVAIGSDIEASILSTAALTDIAAVNIWAKAITTEHGRILERVGAHNVVFPERQMGERVAQVLSHKVVDYFKIDEGFVLAELVAPADLHGIALGDSDIRKKYGVTVVCIKPNKGVFTYAAPETVIGEGDLLIVAGTTEDAERFTDHASR